MSPSGMRSIHTCSPSRRSVRLQTASCVARQCWPGTACAGSVRTISSARLGLRGSRYDGSVVPSDSISSCGNDMIPPARSGMFLSKRFYTYIYIQAVCTYIYIYIYKVDNFSIYTHTDTYPNLSSFCHSWTISVYIYTYTHIRIYIYIERER